MTKKEHINYWIKSSKKDLDTMIYLYKGKKNVQALFFGHLYIEKISKALWIKNNKENYPPKIHNILSILNQSNILLDEGVKLFLLKLNQYQVEGRYPEDLEKLYKFTTGYLTLDYINQIKVIAKCLLKKTY